MIKMNEDLKLHKDHVLEAHKLLDNIKWRIANKTFADLDQVRETLKIVRGELIPLLERYAIDLRWRSGEISFEVYQKLRNLPRLQTEITEPTQADSLRSR